ncbi:hypothetical protein LCGC14_0408280 [marine sediment metagenome]|uniref:site-specific DNA-methyltransferase (adenine-specific) n=2 Tax=root TaxID=1 RepID=A0A7V1BHQ1_9RHOB|nr:Eco57I restriction-modification methylase domain-containing protein [Sulfitobacter litoralis]HDZ53030.1 restriction endonuclease [Sulfitobacter litoralis]
MSNTPTTTVSAVRKMGAADVLDTIANLSNDEVFTPPKLANQVLDLLPKHVWSDSSLKFLDPCVKTGVFLREIVKRLMVGLKDEFPDVVERREHILRNQIYGIAITELTALMSRRTVYCSSDATREPNPDFPENCYSAVKFDEPEGNIAFPLVGHNWPEKKGIIAPSTSCAVCGAKYSDFTGDDREGMENYAYPFIHMDIQEIFGEMQFDVVIGNPPYQIGKNSADKNNAARSIYQCFVEKGDSLRPRYLSFIIPSRWMNGGRDEVSTVRDVVFGSGKTRHLVDHRFEGDIFPGVKVPGGVCYFLLDRQYTGGFEYTYHSAEFTGSVSNVENPSQNFYRDPRSSSIINKVKSKCIDSMNTVVSSQKPYGLRNNFPAQPGRLHNSVEVITSSGIEYADADLIRDPMSNLCKYKIFLSKTTSENGGKINSDGARRLFSRIIVGEPNQVCSETYLAIGSYDEENSANNMMQFLRTRFVRYLAGCRIDTQNISKDKFDLIPLLDMSRSWCDAELFEFFDLSIEEIELICSTIKEMP